MDKECASLRLSPLTSGRWRLGWKGCCCGWLLLDLLAISRMLCSVAVPGVMLPTVHDLHRNKKNRQGKKWPETLRFPPVLTAPARRERFKLPRHGDIV